MVYFPINFPVHFDPHGRGNEKPETTESPLVTRYSDDGATLAVMCRKTVYLWTSNPLAMVGSYQRSSQSLQEYGDNLRITWGREGSVLCIATSLGYLVFLKVSVTGQPCRLQNRVTGQFVGGLGHHTKFESEVFACQAGTTAIKHKITSIVSRLDEVMVATTAGAIERFSWTTRSFNAAAAIVLHNVSFFSAPQHVSEADHVVCMEHNPAVRCLAFAASNGGAGVICASNTAFDKNVKGYWAVPPPRHIGSSKSPQRIKKNRKATCVAINHRFRLLAVGYDDGDVDAFTIQQDFSLTHSHALPQYSSQSGIPSRSSTSGPVSTMKYTEDGYALAVGWKQGGVTVWSVFGCLLMSTANDSTMSASAKDTAIDGVISLAWGPQGYVLLAVSSKTTKLTQYKFVKSALTNNASLSNQFNVALQGDRTICVNPDMGDGRSPRNVDKLLDLQWQMLQVPTAYLQQNWPIRYTAVGPSGQYLAIAGRRGVAHFNMQTSKWRLFGNQSQEQSLECSGGIVWWEEYLVVSCKNATTGQYEVRFFPRDANLDNRYMTHVQMMTREVLLLNVCHERLIVYTSGRRVLIFGISRGEAANNEFAPVQLQIEWEVDLKDYVSNAANVISLNLLYETNETTEQNSAALSGLIANVAGDLMLFALEPNDEGEQVFSPPALLANGVENYWAWSPSVFNKPLERHLAEALWLGCGGEGMKVWMPLYHGEPGSPSKRMLGGPSGEGLSKCVMLPFMLNIYPLSVLFADAVVLGASHDVHHLNGSKTPYYALERKTQIYLHHILRQLLRRSQNTHALEIAHACEDLSYFPHVLELMLHEVLEAEANVELSVDIAQLPRVSDFLTRFPYYLETIVHCARKTEVAKWNYLFSVVGDANTLFETCIAKHKLQTASSYLIILQSLESPAASKKHAGRILTMALVDENWDLSKDLVRFLQATSSYRPSSDHGSSNSKKVQPDDSKSFGQVFGDHALELFRTHRIRALGRFSAHLRFPLVNWLRSIRSREGLTLKFDDALPRVINDFGMDNQLGKQNENKNGEEADPSRKSSTLAEVVFMMNIFFEAKFFDWAFLCAVVINDEDAAFRVLEEVALDKETSDGVFGIMKRFQPGIQNGSFGDQFAPLFEKVSTKYRSALPIPTDLERERPESVQDGSCAVS
eukprot:m.137406 g.137406  ORF g.137406 m.137406 type:complete len:1155 (+) comp29919_c1_seq1:317-3781(+)